MKALLVNQAAEEPVMKMGTWPDPEPKENELLVKIRATALNRADLLQKAGKYPPPEGESSVLGLEMSGVVEAVGKNVTKYTEGDRVFGLLGSGGYAEYCTIDEEMAMPVPDHLSFEEATAIPEVFLTAYQALIWLGELDQQETVLIHAGASGVGTATIQLARALRKARVAVTAGSREKLELCRSLGASILINYREENHADVLREKVGPGATDLIVDFIGSPYWHMNIESLAMDGRLIYLSMLGGTDVEEVNLVPLLRKRLTVRGSTLRNRSSEYKKELTEEFSSRALGLFKSEELTPVISAIFNWENVEDAHRMMAENRNAGKVILNRI